MSAHDQCLLNISLQEECLVCLEYVNFSSVLSLDPKSRRRTILLCRLSFEYYDLASRSMVTQFTPWYNLFVHLPSRNIENSIDNVEIKVESTTLTWVAIFFLCSA
jgi:hypothetical protein